jgi:molecular chaperone GrpE
MNSPDSAPWPGEDVPPVQAENAAEADQSPMFGAIDIVEAFTALRHELKLQVRGGRDLQQLLVDGLQRVEQKLAASSVAVSQVAGGGGAGGGATEAGRDLAEALAEMEESLQRVHAALARSTSTEPTIDTQPSDSQLDDSPAERFSTKLDEQIAQAPWWLRKFATAWLSSCRQSLVAVLAEEVGKREESSSDEQLKTAQQGIELLHARAQRLMQQCQLERIDVIGQPFDAESMHAVDVISAPETPAAHVAEQLRPAYRWRGKLLRYADVRLAK